MEIENILTDIKHDYTYSTVESYLVDTFTLGDSPFDINQMINDTSYSVYQLSILTVIQSIF